MALSYESTRGGQKGVTASQAILKGLAEDGGLFMPTEIPKLDKTLEQLAGMTYQETAYEVMKLFLTDYTEEELKSCIANAYDDKFDTEEIAPLAKADGAYFLELYHGSTIAFKDMALSMDEALDAWQGTLERVFPTRATEDKEKVQSDVYDTKNIYVCRNKVAKPTVFIPVFPGTNCEYDSAKAFERAGANTIVKVFKNLSAADIRDSVDEFVKAINQSQIIMFPGGFSAGDEPEGSAKFFATAFRNAKMTEAVGRLLSERDGLALGICNGFQALIKLGLVPYGQIQAQSADSPTLTYNTIGRHVSKMVYTKVVTNKSPWLAGAELGGVYCNPASHGEGRFVAPKEWLDKLFENGQVATQYVNEAGVPTMDEEWNVNGSYMAIEGITSPDGRVLGKMAHAERRGESVAVNIYGEQDMKLFESGVAYFK